jgi:hypothetical protein
MTDQDSGAQPSAASRRANKTPLLIAAAVVLVLVVAAVVYAASGSSDSKAGAITGDVKGQFVTQDVSCHKIGFKAPDLTKSQLYACDVKNVAESNRPNGHIHDNAFTRCYVRSGTDQTVDVSHAIFVIATDRHKKPPCS